LALSERNGAWFGGRFRDNSHSMFKLFIPRLLVKVFVCEMKTNARG